METKSWLKEELSTIVRKMNVEKKKEKKNQKQQNILVDTNTCFKVGMQIRITECLNGHEYAIGEVVKIVEKEKEHDLSLSWLCRNSNGIEWYISEQEGVPDKSETKQK